MSREVVRSMRWLITCVLIVTVLGTGRGHAFALQLPASSGVCMEAAGGVATCRHCPLWILPNVHQQYRVIAAGAVRRRHVSALEMGTRGEDTGKMFYVAVCTSVSTRTYEQAVAVDLHLERGCKRCILPCCFPCLDMVKNALFFWLPQVASMLYKSLPCSVLSVHTSYACG